jgi:GTP cyclohydrolase II
MLGALGVARVDLLSNNPDKAAQLRAAGIAVRDQVPTGVFATENNVRYLRAKAEQTGHTLSLPGIAS